MKPSPQKLEAINFKATPDVSAMLAEEIRKRPGVVKTYILNETLRLGFQAKKRNGKVANV